MKGYKGFKKGLICLSYQYEENKIHILDERFKKFNICSWGFHFCKNLKDVNNYYNFKDLEHEFWEIEALDKIVEDGDKCITNKIRLVRKINIFEYLIKEKLEIFRELPTNTILGGSLALMLHGVINFRFSKDLDIVQPYFIDIPGAIYEFTNSFSTDKEATKVHYKDACIDLFLDSKAVYKIITFNGYDYKVQMPEKIIEAKMRYFMQGIEKHKEDISKYLNWKFQHSILSTDLNNDLPF